MHSTILAELKRNKATPCVSVIIPTHETYPERSMDEVEVNKMLDKAKELLLFKYKDNSNRLEVLSKLNKLAGEVDYLHNEQGIGFFVSPGVSQLVKFPFPVKNKIIVGESFEIRDILYLSETMINYFVLLINDNEIKLYSGMGDKLKLVKDKNFPVQFLDDYEYAHTSLGSSYGYALKSTEKDKSIIKEIRFKTHLKHIDERISEYMIFNAPMIVSGSSKELGYFNKITVNSKHIVGKINGNYVHQSGRLGELAFIKIKEYIMEEENRALTRLDDAIGKRLAVWGIRDVWKAAKEAKGLMLLVEKDYSVPGFVTEDDMEILTLPPEEKHEIVSDAVDDIMETVIQKNGKVVILENGKLDQFGRIALILRYW